MAEALIAGLADLYPLPLRDVQAPTLLVRGGSSGWRARVGGFWLARRLPNARLAVLERAGHWLVNERDSELAAMVAAFAGAGV